MNNITPAKIANNNLVCIVTLCFVPHFLHTSGL
jgi:hypothetical protein